MTSTKLQIQHFEIRQEDNLKLLQDFMCDDTISIVNDFLGNDVISLNTRITYKNKVFKYSRRPYFSTSFVLYHQLSIRRKKCMRKIIKYLFK